ncbi:hypothetical protein AAG747_18560 [Rapidithrix thailandica]|uniref:Copper chaperone n=1 Tax=Rapidithrix thailandica TaxID=413964 RepID=A0AAW9SC41_9BACT
MRIQSITTKKEVFVFRTNLPEKVPVKLPLDHLPGVIEWNTDLEDCDRILRVVSEGANLNEVIHSIKALGYQCEELEDKCF